MQQKNVMPNVTQALAGRLEKMPIENSHFVNKRPIQAPFSKDDAQLSLVAFGLGCFWGAERVFWQLDGVYTTAVGYGAGYTPNPTYEEVCSGMTGHNELVLVVYRPSDISFNKLLTVFFESHNPTQGMRQGNDTGTQYRSGIYFFDLGLPEQALAQRALDSYQVKLNEAGLKQITTEITKIDEFYYAEQYHQQYLAKNPNGYCGIGGTGVQCSLPEQ